MLFKDNLYDIINVLENGGVILYPTDTIWGIGCDATNEEAIKKINQIKERDTSKPMSILVDGIDLLHNYIEQIHPRIETLLTHHRRALTIVYNNGRNLPYLLLGQNNSIGIRIVKDDFCRDLISLFGKPIVSTSANKSGAAFPSNFGEISTSIIEKVDYVVKHRQEEKDLFKPSVVAAYDQKGELYFLRK